jgi:hypothetical protein
MDFNKFNMIISLNFNPILIRIMEIKIKLLINYKLKNNLNF